MSGSLLQRLLIERETKNSGGIYHLTQIKLAYNSNHIEGTQLTEDETRSLYETRSILPDGKHAYHFDDMVITANHFRAFDYILDHAADALTEDMMKKLHGILFTGTAAMQDETFAIGDYKRIPNMIGAGTETSAPEDVPAAIQNLLCQYQTISSADEKDVIDFHARFEKIHPFQDGNGRVGRLLMFKECLRSGITPIVIFEDMKEFYYRGLKMYPQEPGWLMDTCLSGQDRYAAYCKKLVPDRDNRKAQIKNAEQLSYDEPEL